ncbi:MAG TPA: hypothetical protein VIL50_05935, partial [Candidatus Limnocylindrales bacterium]
MAGGLEMVGDDRDGSTRLLPSPPAGCSIALVEPGRDRSMQALARAGQQLRVRNLADHGVAEDIARSLRIESEEPGIDELRECGLK